MGKVVQPRIFKKTAAEIASHIEGYITKLSDDYTVTIRVNGEEISLDDFAEKATPGARVELHVANDGNPEEQRVELYAVTNAVAPRGGEGLITGEVAQTLRQYNELLGRFVQTVGDMQRIIGEQNKGTLAVTKDLRKLLKAASKATRRSFKDRRRADESESGGAFFKGLIKEMSDVLGPEKTFKILDKGFDRAAEAFGLGKAADSPGARGAAPVSEGSSGSGDKGADAGVSGDDVVSPGSGI